MAELMTTQLAFEADTHKPRDRVVHTLQFRNNGSAPGEWDPGDQFGTDLAAAFKTFYNNRASGDRFQNGVYINHYSEGDAKPRTPVRTQFVPFVALGGDGIGEVALCLSYYHDSNRPRNRGRIYLGPFGSSFMAARPAAALQTAVLDLGSALAGIGGANIDWCVRSQPVPTAPAEFKAVSHVWVDDSWDTMRSRGKDSTARQVRATGP